MNDLGLTGQGLDGVAVLVQAGRLDHVLLGEAPRHAGLDGARAFSEQAALEDALAAGAQRRVVAEARRARRTRM